MTNVVTVPADSDIEVFAVPGFHGRPQYRYRVNGFESRENYANRGSAHYCATLVQFIGADNKAEPFERAERNGRLPRSLRR